MHPSVLLVTNALARHREDWPLLLLVLASLLAPLVVLGQGGNWHVALFSCPATLLAPTLALEAMLGLARVGDRMRRGGR